MESNEKQEPSTKDPVMDEEVFTESNRENTKKGLKILAIILGVFLGIDLISLIVIFCQGGIS